MRWRGGGGRAVAGVRRDVDERTVARRGRAVRSLGVQWRARGGVVYKNDDYFEI